MGVRRKELKNSSKPSLHGEKHRPTAERSHNSDGSPYRHGTGRNPRVEAKQQSGEPKKTQQGKGQKSTRPRHEFLIAKQTCLTMFPRFSNWSLTRPDCRPFEYPSFTAYASAWNSFLRESMFINTPSRSVSYTHLTLPTIYSV